jgi:hypothetical protein
LTKIVAHWLRKQVAPAELVMAIHAALRGRTFITPALADDGCARASNALARRAEPAAARNPAAAGGGPLGEADRGGARHLAPHRQVLQVMEAHGLHTNAELIHFAIKHGNVTI